MSLQAGEHRGRFPGAREGRVESAGTRVVPSPNHKHPKPPNVKYVLATMFDIVFGLGGRGRSTKSQYISSFIWNVHHWWLGGVFLRGRDEYGSPVKQEAVPV